MKRYGGTEPITSTSQSDIGAILMLHQFTQRIANINNVTLPRQLMKFIWDREQSKQQSAGEGGINTNKLTQVNNMHQDGSNY